MNSGKRSWAASRALLAPFFLTFGFIFFLPLFFLVGLSFSSSLGIGSRFTLDNYVKAFSSMFVMKYVWSIVTSAASSLMAVLFGFPVAYFLARGKGAWTGIAQISVLVPLFGLTYYAYTLLFSFAEGGIVNYVLVALKLIPEPIDFVMGANRTILIIMAMGVTSIPLTSLVMIGAIQGIDPALEEVSLCCGANEVQTFRHITLGLCKRSLLASGLLVFGANIVAFTFPLILGMGDDRWVAVAILHLATSFLKYNLTSAVAVVLLAVTSVISYGYIRLTKGGVGLT
jgi:ABC-type spermidine/putrescine transport system permease subunit I